MKQPVPEDACLDSLNVLGALLGHKNATGRDHLVQQDNGKVGNYGLRVGNWKLVRHDRKQARNLIVETTLTNTEVPQYQLFDLSSDPEEKHDLSTQFPQKMQELTARLADVIAAGRTRPAKP